MLLSVWDESDQVSVKLYRLIVWPWNNSILWFIEALQLVSKGSGDCMHTNTWLTEKLSLETELHFTVEPSLTAGWVSDQAGVWFHSSSLWPIGHNSLDITHHTSFHAGYLQLSPLPQRHLHWKQISKRSEREQRERENKCVKPVQALVDFKQAGAGGDSAQVNQPTVAPSAPRRLYMDIASRLCALLCWGGWLIRVVCWVPDAFQWQSIIGVLISLSEGNLCVNRTLLFGQVVLSLARYGSLSTFLSWNLWWW